MVVVAEKAQPAALTGNLGNYLLSLAAKAQKKLSKKISTNFQVHGLAVFDRAESTV